MSVITIKINGQFVSKSSKNAGSAGSSNACTLRFIFDESWRGFAKRVLWRDPKGENLTSVILTPDVEDALTYESTIPPIVMAEAGWCSFTVEGYYLSSPEKVNKSVSDSLFVDYSENGEILPPAPSEAIQLHAEFEALMPKVNELMGDTKKEITDFCNEQSVWENYNDEKLYKKGNKVFYNGNSYICINECFGTSPENDACWIMIAQRGERGQRGFQGPQGVCGETGAQGEKGDKGDKGDKGEKGDKGDRGINGSIVPSNGFYTFSVDEDGDLWITYPDNADAPEAMLSDNGELLLTVGGDKPCTFNIGSVRGPAFTYDDFTQEQKDELLLLALPDVNAANKAVEDARIYSNAAFGYAEDAKESEENAKDAESVAEQALSDLLEMINSGDIILASDGKIPLSAIPATATQEIYRVESEDDLTGLVAQRGDLAELIETINGEMTVTKVWQCLGESTIRENWVIWGTSYAVQAGNATYADTSSNALTINGHRMVEMSEEAFASAVKDEDTYYLVY